jgi:hypothetical protein
VLVALGVSAQEVDKRLWLVAGYLADCIADHVHLASRRVHGVARAGDRERNRPFLSEYWCQAGTRVPLRADRYDSSPASSSRASS